MSEKQEKVRFYWLMFCHSVVCVAIGAMLVIMAEMYQLQRVIDSQKQRLDSNSPYIPE